MSNHKKWFPNIGTRPSSPNRILPLIDGDDVWRQVAYDLSNAKKNIHICMWVFNINTELIRKTDKTFKEPSARVQDTILRILTSKAASGVTVRLLLWNIPVLSQHIILRALASLPKDNFEILEESHPSIIGSYHQKTISIDGQIAYVGGMNLKENDWDTSSHNVYDYRRTPHNTSAKKRISMRDNKELPNFPPRHDFFARMEGPLVSDTENNFVQRWNAAINSGVVWSKNATVVSNITPPSKVGDQKGQIVRTMPNCKAAPTGEVGILESYRRAIRNAKSYIYIENQYFRSQIIAKELALACKKNPKLILIVVTKPDFLTEIEADDWWKVASPSTHWSSKAFNIIKKVRSEFCLFYLQVFDRDSKSKPLFVPIDNHAKIMIVDDIWWTIGSCNINDRGFLYEGEINVSVLHKYSAKDLRRRLWTEHLGEPCPEDISDATKLWLKHASLNFNSWKNDKKPKSRIFSFAQNGPLLPVVPATWF